MDSLKALVPRLLAEISIAPAGDRCKMLVGDLDGDGAMELLMVQPDGGIDDRYVPHRVQCLSAFRLDGELMWQRGSPSCDPGGPGSDYPAQIHDIDGDGRNEVLAVMDGRFLILDGATGSTKRSFPLPDPEAHDCIIVADLRASGFAGDIILKDRYRRLWAFDGDFRLLWTWEGNVGHYPWPFDADGDGADELMAGYDLLDQDGRRLWSCVGLQEHADCLWAADVMGKGEPQIVVGGSVTALYDVLGRELWRYELSIESQHVAPGRFLDGAAGLQVAGLDRIRRGDVADQATGRDGIFLLDSSGRELRKEDRKTPGWLTIIEPLSGWDEGGLDLILAYRRGGGLKPALYDAELKPRVAFPVDGYLVHADLRGSGREEVLVYDNSRAWIFEAPPLSVPGRGSVPGADALGGASSTARAGKGLVAAHPGKPLKQPKRLSHSTLYPGGELGSTEGHA